MEDSSNNEQVEFPELDAIILWLIERLDSEIAEAQLVALADRFLHGHLIVILNKKYVVVAPPSLKKIDWEALEKEKAGKKNA